MSLPDKDRLPVFATRHDMIEQSFSVESEMARQQSYQSWILMRKVNRMRAVDETFCAYCIGRRGPAGVSGRRVCPAGVSDLPKSNKSIISFR